MKVYIGPYPSRLTSRLYDNYMNKKYDYKWPETQTSLNKNSNGWTIKFNLFITFLIGFGMIAVNKK